MPLFEATELNIKKAASILGMGDLVSFPTETVYGLGADARDERAVQKIYALKTRPSNNPLICHVANIEDALEIAVFSEDALRIAKAFWPGPLTLILPLKKNASIAKNITAGLNSIAIRVPSHSLAKKLLEKCSFPIAAPSANISGKITSTTASHVAAYFDKLFILDGGESEKGLESTILDLSEKPYQILRIGSILEKDLLRHIDLGKRTQQSIKAPGMLLKHYAPNLPLRLNALKAERDEILIKFGIDGPYNLSEAGDLKEAAHRLFSILHEVDNLSNIKRIAVMPIPMSGVGIAINDRLKRAAAR